MVPLIIIGLIVVIFGYIISTYNNLQITKTRIDASIQEIGNQLKRQANLIPNLIEATKGYLSHEKGIFDELTSARESIMASKDQTTMSKAVELAGQVLPKFLALAESNPEIKADGVVSKLMNEVRDTADKLMYSRRTLIDLSQDFNAKLLVFPSNIIANQFGFKPTVGLQTPMTGDHLTVSQQELSDVSVKL